MVIHMRDEVYRTNGVWVLSRGHNIIVRLKLFWNERYSAELNCTGLKSFTTIRLLSRK